MIACSRRPAARAGPDLALPGSTWKPVVTRVSSVERVTGTSATTVPGRDAGAGDASLTAASGAGGLAGGGKHGGSRHTVTDRLVQW